MLNTFDSDFNCTTRKSTLSDTTVFLLHVMCFAPRGLNRGFTVAIYRYTSEGFSSSCSPLSFKRVYLCDKECQNLIEGSY